MKCVSELFAVIINSPDGDERILAIEIVNEEGVNIKAPLVATDLNYLLMLLPGVRDQVRESGRTARLIRVSKVEVIEDIHS